MAGPVRRDSQTRSHLNFSYQEQKLHSFRGRTYFFGIKEALIYFFRATSTNGKSRARRTTTTYPVHRPCTEYPADQRSKTKKNISTKETRQEMALLEIVHFHARLPMRFSIHILPFLFLKVMLLNFLAHIFIVV